MALVFRKVSVQDANREVSLVQGDSRCQGWRGRFVEVKLWSEAVERRCGCKEVIGPAAGVMTENLVSVVLRIQDLRQPGP